PLDQTVVLNSQSASSTPLGGAVTISKPVEAAVSIVAAADAITGISLGNSFVNDSDVSFNGWAHLITSTPGTYAAQWNQNPAGTYAVSTVFFKAAGALNACDLTSDGVVNVLDVQLGVNMSLVPPMLACTANINGAGVCNQTTVQRVAN